MKRTLPVLIAAFAVCSIFAACSEPTTTAKAPEGEATPNKSVSEDTEESNRKLVMDFYQSLLGDKDSTAIDKYVSDTVKQHHPLLHDGKEGLKGDLRPYFLSPGLKKTNIDFVASAADGDYVWLHIRDVAPNGKVYARVTIFKVTDGKIVEAWKVSEPAPEGVANDNGAF
ncbi:MAG TPA: nuclear transport factor 2 family protein [Phnomibacter sp.]|nr:nuclear transport factor 2 family protein [Phnomibacter sp.]